jgi:hypothetical protein
MNELSLQGHLNKINDGNFAGILFSIDFLWLYGLLIPLLIDIRSALGRLL